LSHRLAYSVNSKTLKILLGYSFFYMACNYYGQQIRGRPLYPFSDWNKPFQTIAILYAINLVVLLAYWQIGKWTVKTQHIYISPKRD